MSKYYDEKYSEEGFFWGSVPSSMARIQFQKFPPQEEQRLLDVACGEGRDSIFFAQNGYRVSGFDSSSQGVKKASARAAELGLSIDFFQADINLYRMNDLYDVVFSSGGLHYIEPHRREEILSNYKDFTLPGGLHSHTVPIDKPFLEKIPNADELEHKWRSGEILTHYYDWKIEFFVESILDDIKSGCKFPVNRIIARKPPTQ